MTTDRPDPDDPGGPGSDGPPGPAQVDPEAPTVVSSSTQDDLAPPIPVDPNAPTVLEGAEPAVEPVPPPPPPVEDPRLTLSRGTVLFGEYEIEGLLGSGGMGAVYRAKHRRLGEARAIKVLQPSFGANQEVASKLFDREAKALLKLRDPAVVRCHDLLSDDEGRVYLVMELVEGIALLDRIQEGPLSKPEVVALGRRLATGLSAAHRQGIVHRDLAPDNVVLPDGRPEGAKLIDFGIAKEFESSHTTVLDGFKGKLRYASPEQMGFFDGKIDGRSDYYSLGLTLFTAATGRPLEMGRTFAQAVDARRSFQGLPKGIPPQLRDLIQPLLAFDPKDRPSSLEEHFGLTQERGELAASESTGGGRIGVWVGGAVGAAAAGALIAWLSMGGFGSLGGRSDPVEPAAAQAAPSGTDAPVPAEPSVAPREPEPTVAKAPAAPRPKLPTAQEKAALIRRQLQIDSLLRSGATAVRENRLTRPVGESALDKYRRVLELDPKNRAAREGLATVSGRLIDMSGAALRRGNVDQARDLFEKAEATTPDHPGLAELRTRFEGDG